MPSEQTTTRQVEMKIAPKGVVCILIDPQGRVWATASDFATAAGDQRETQTRRAERQCALELGRQAIAGSVLGGFEGWDLENLMQRLIANKGWRLHRHVIGYSEAEA